MFGALDRERLGEFGGEKVLKSIQALVDGDFGGLDANSAFNIFDTLGVQDALGLESLGGIVGQFDASIFEELGNPGAFDVVKALEARDFEALDTAAAFGFCTILDHSQLTEVEIDNLIGLFSSVGEGASNLPADHINSYINSIGTEDIGTLDPAVAGNLVGAAGDDDISNLASDLQEAYLNTLAADLLGIGAAGFGAAGTADTVFNFLPPGAYVDGSSLSDAIGAANPFAGLPFGGVSP